MQLLKRTSIVVAMAVMVGLMASPVSAQPITVFQDTFDSEPQGLVVTSLTNWTVTAGSVDVIGPGLFDFYPGNGNYLDMTSCADGTIQTAPLNLSPGTYQLSFEIGRNSINNSLLVSLGGVYSESFLAPSILTLITRQITVTTLTTASLRFQETGAPPQDCGGSILDDVLLQRIVIFVDIDIKPGSDPNSINCNDEKGVIPVATLTNGDFDATTVDHTTVMFEDASETHVGKKSGEPRRHEEDVDGDGDTDLVFHFRLGETDLTCSSTEGTLTGETFDGQAIEGTDAVRMVDGS